MHECVRPSERRGSWLALGGTVAKRVKVWYAQQGEHIHIFVGQIEGRFAVIPMERLALRPVDVWKFPAFGILPVPIDEPQIIITGRPPEDAFQKIQKGAMPGKERPAIVNVRTVFRCTADAMLGNLFGLANDIRGRQAAHFSDRFPE